jgi:hypothetical protein
MRGLDASAAMADSRTAFFNSEDSGNNNSIRSHVMPNSMGVAATANNVVPGRAQANCASVATVDVKGLGKTINANFM